MLLWTAIYMFFLNIYIHIFSICQKTEITRSYDNSNFLKNCKLLCKVSEPLYNSSSKIEALQFLHLLVSIGYHPTFLFIATLVDVMWHLIESLLYISFMTDDVEHLFIFLWSLYIFFGEWLFKSFACVFFFLNWVVGLLLLSRNISLYILDTKFLSDIWFATILSPSLHSLLPVLIV